jgi:hypothetical protein
VLMTARATTMYFSGGSPPNRTPYKGIYSWLRQEFVGGGEKGYHFGGDGGDW